MDKPERRKYKRLGAKFDIFCSKVGSISGQTHSGCTQNVSPGGLYFETTADAFEKGNLLKVELSIPPSPGLLQFGGKVAGFAKVLRTDSIRNSITGTGPSYGRYGVAVQFCHPPKLRI